MRTKRLLKTSVAALTTAVLSLSLAACGGDNSNHDMSSMGTQTASNGDVFDQADVDFATNMIPHHAQAVQMVNMTQGRTLDPAVQQLAEQIRQAQVPEIETMTHWLTSWGKKVPATSTDHEHADMGGMDSMKDMDTNMPGMMSADEMKQLDKASDAEFQNMWLQMMIKHHEGAIAMAKTEQQDGKFAAAVSLARSIITSQQAEIDQMKQLLGK